MGCNSAFKGLIFKVLKYQVFYLLLFLLVLNEIGLATSKFKSVFLQRYWDGRILFYPLEFGHAPCSLWVVCYQHEVHCTRCFNYSYVLSTCLLLTWSALCYISVSVHDFRTSSISFNSIKLLKPTGHVMHQQFNSQQLYALTTLYLWFCIYLRTNRDLCHLQHKLIGFYNRDEKCLQGDTDWVFK